MAGNVSCVTLTTTGAATIGGAATFNAGAVIGASQALTGTAANSTISGFLSVAATTGTFTNVGGTLSTAAQPNVTSLGTLTSLAVGTVTSTGGFHANIAGGSVANPTATPLGLGFWNGQFTGGGYAQLAVGSYNGTPDYAAWIQASNGSTVQTLRINPVGGAVSIGASTSAVTIPGTLGVTGAITGGEATFASVLTSTSLTDVPNATATTVFTVADGDVGILFAWLDTNPQFYSIAFVAQYSVNVIMRVIVEGGLTMSLSTYNFQITQTTGVNQNIRMSFVRVKAA